MSSWANILFERSKPWCFFHISNLSKKWILRLWTVRFSLASKCPPSHQLGWAREDLFLEVKSQKEDINLVLVLHYQPVSLYNEVNFTGFFNPYVAKKSLFWLLTMKGLLFLCKKTRPFSPLIHFLPRIETATSKMTYKSTYSFPLDSVFKRVIIINCHQF